MQRRLHSWKESAEASVERSAETVRPRMRQQKKARKNDVEMAIDEVRIMGLGDYGSVLDSKHCIGLNNEL